MPNWNKIVLDKTPAWVRGISKKELIEFIGEFEFSREDLSAVYNYFSVDELRKICKKGGINKNPEKVEKSELIQRLIEYQSEEILNLADLNDLRRIVKSVLETLRLNKFKVLVKQAEKEKSEATPEAKSSEFQNQAEENEQSQEETKKLEESADSEIFLNTEEESKEIIVSE